MGLSLWLHLFLIFILQLQFVHYYYPTQALSYSLPPHNHSVCPFEQSLALLQFKQNFNINSSASEDCDFFSQSPRPKTKSWNRTIDCCKWEGVTCDGLTGHVIGLDLSCSQLHGTLHSNSTLFKLSHLKRLNLAFNDFSRSRIWHQFSQFASLRHLNLSYSNFIGDVPSEIPHLWNLVSLDLSYLYHVKLETSTFEMLLQNLTQLRQLSLSSVNIFPAIFPVNLSSSLTLLDLSDTGLHGNLPDEVLHLPNLQKLMLSGNKNLTVYFPKATNVRSNSPLRWLDLSGCNVFGNLPEWLGNFTQVTHLNLYSSNINTTIPSSIGNLTQLESLDLSSNSLTGPIPSSIGNLTQLESLDLSSNSLTGPIPSSIGNLAQLEYLCVLSNSLTGPIPSSIGNLTQLEFLDLRCNSLTGPIPSSIGNLIQLEYLYLSSNSLTGPIPSSIGNLIQLKSLSLSSNSLTGPIPSSIGNLTQLKSLSLVFNSLTGPIPSSIGNLTQLERLNLSSNSLTGPIPSSIGNLTQLEGLDLSSNSLTGPIPSSIGNLTQLEDLDLSSNSLTGPIPSSIGNLTQLVNLHLSNNSLTGPIMSSIGKLTQLAYLDLSSNSLIGPIPHSITKLMVPEVLDLSHNNLSGEILPCLGNFSSQLSVLNLEANSFQGTIPTTFAQVNMFMNLNFNGNQLEGKLPRSLANCKQLEVLDLGNNHINDTFPTWLGTLPKLKVLVFKSNRFHGSIPNNANAKSPFSKLQIFDLSNNEFSGRLPSTYFRYFKAIMKVQEYNTEPEYMSITKTNSSIHYLYSVKVVMKGMERELEKILTAFTTIDMSNNKFEGEVPNYIGNLRSLRELNLSHNQLVGHIPTSLGKLSVLESLDLSFNQLVGEIPQQLTGLTSLEILNLSQNHLVGCIPQGKQFTTFGNDSYSGNSALRGFPLSKGCGDDETPHQRSPTNLQQDDDSGFESGFTWKAVCLGYGCGTILGLVMGYLMFLTGKPKWLTGLVKEYQYKNRMKRGRQRRARRRN